MLFRPARIRFHFFVTTLNQVLTFELGCSTLSSVLRYATHSTSGWYGVIYSACMVMEAVWTETPLRMHTYIHTYVQILRLLDSKKKAGLSFPADFTKETAR